MHKKVSMILLITAVLVGIGMITYVVYRIIPVNKSVKATDLRVTLNDSKTEIKDSEMLVSLLEKAANSGEHRIINKKVTENELKKLQNKGILITKQYAKGKEIPVAGFTEPKQVTKITVAITDNIKWAIVYLETDEVVVEIEDIICNEIKSCLD